MFLQEISSLKSITEHMSDQVTNQEMKKEKNRTSFFTSPSVPFFGVIVCLSKSNPIYVSLLS
jgi:hypothetical protein